MDIKSLLSDCVAAFTQSDIKSRQALLLSGLLVCLVTLHRGALDSAPNLVPELEPATVDRQINLSGPVNDSAHDIAQALITASQADTHSAAQRIFSRLKTTRLLQQGITAAPIDQWVSEQPELQPKRKLGLSRPKWRSYSHVSLQQRYGQSSSEKIYTVMIDPGHGGSDPGAKSFNGLLEKEITLDIARRTALFLSEVDNVRVQLTRQSDRGMSRAHRVAEIKNSDSDIVVSLHLNHLPQTELTLVETFYAGPENIRESQLKRAEEAASGKLVKMSTNQSHDLQFTKLSRTLAHIMQERVYDEVRLSNDSADSAGVKEDTLFVLTRSYTPGVLIEMTALSNVQEATRLTTSEYRNRLAAALADGIRDYVALASSADSI